MIDESLYSTSNEAALAIVATSMKKARLPIEILIVNSFMGGVLFTTGGMMHVVVSSYSPALRENNPGIMNMLEGFFYPIGLFYVVITGTDLFNSNVLFFSVGLVRGAVSTLDLVISWFISYWFNLVANIFVCYIFCNFSHISKQEDFVQGSIEILMQKASYSFVDNLIKGIAGNFFVSLAVYLQLMAKPLHVKFFMILLPVFSFVTMGFTHAVGDMYSLIIGLINHAPISLGNVVWKIMLPGVIGNIIGGSFFGIVIPWYLHLYAVERDQRRLRLPEYDAKDEQPEINADSRVIRKVPRAVTEDYEDVPELDPTIPEKQEYSSFSLSSGNNPSVNPPQQLVNVKTRDLDHLSRMYSRTSGVSRFSTGTARHISKSPKNVFPIYGMTPSGGRERSIASGMNINEVDEDAMSTHTARTDLQNYDDISATYIGDHLKTFFSNMTTNSKRNKDIESQNQRHPSMNRAQSTPVGINENHLFQRETSEFSDAQNSNPIKQPKMSPSNKITNPITKYSTQPESISPGYSPVLSIDSEILAITTTQPPVQDSNQSSFNIANYQPKARDSKET